jgi:hypothetical protein
MDDRRIVWNLFLGGCKIAGEIRAVPDEKEPPNFRQSPCCHPRFRGDDATTIGDDIEETARSAPPERRKPSNATDHGMYGKTITTNIINL